MMPRRTAVLAAVALLACAACDVWSTPPEDGDQLTFAVREVDWWTPPEPKIVLLVATKHEYPCFNYGIEGDLTIHDHTIRLAMSGDVKIGQICLTAFGPAQFRSELPIGEGTYLLEFVRGGDIDRYTLTVTAVSIGITHGVGSFTRPEERLTPR